MSRWNAPVLGSLRSLVVLAALGHSLAPGSAPAGEVSGSTSAAAEAEGDASADKGGGTKGKKKKSSGPSTPPGKPASGPDAKPAPRPSSGDHARQPSPVQPELTPVAGRSVPTPRTTPSTAVRGAPERNPAQSISAARRVNLAPHRPLADARRPYDASKRQAAPPPPWRRPDHRYARPDWRHLRPHPHAAAPPPPAWFYKPWYAHWWVHPYWRYTHASYVVVHFDFVVHAWLHWWVPPLRPGWTWVPGYWSYGYWHPGYWRPLAPPPVRQGVTYVYVPGWWQGDIYVDGYWRPTMRTDGDWVWVDGYYLEDGTYVSGHWRPAGHGPEGYVWVPGFFDGETWVGGFWRPEYYPGYVWVSGGFDEDGVFHAGYWEPIDDNPGHVWVPGWFDGTQWIQGYWVTEEEYQQADPENWQPEEGWNDGWQEQGAATPTAPAEPEVPLAIPVEVSE